MLYDKATAGCGVGVVVGVSMRKHKRTAPVALILGRAAVLPPPLATLPSPSPPVARTLVPSVCLAPSSLPPLVLLHISYPHPVRLARPVAVLTKEAALAYTLESRLQPICCGVVERCQNAEASSEDKQRATWLLPGVRGAGTALHPR